MDETIYTGNSPHETVYTTDSSHTNDESPIENNFFDLSKPVFDDWKITDKLGEGSYGVVYRIERVQQDFESEKIQYAALKVITIPKNKQEELRLLNSGMDQDSITKYYRKYAERIYREIELMIPLRGHSNIVSYENHKIFPRKDQIGWDILIQMELLTPFPQYSSTHKMDQKEILQLGIDLCKALEACAVCHIIHRDIKPDNIFISNLGNFKLGDFGIARIADGSTAGTVAGTYTYMAPEMYKENTYNSTVDTYSLGLVLYQLLNGGRLPFWPPVSEAVVFGDEGRAQSRRMSGEEIPPISGIDAQLSDIICKACNYDAKKRYQSPTQFRQAIENYLNLLENEASEETETLDESVSYPPVAEAENKSQAPSTVVQLKDESQVLPTVVQTEEELVAPPTVVQPKEEPAAPPTVVQPKEEPAAPPTVVQPKEEPATPPVAVEPEPKPEVPVSGRADLKKKNRHFALIAAVILVILLVAGGGYYLSTTTVVPEVAYMKFAEAEQVLQDSHLSATQTLEYDDRVQKDFVISVENAGKRVKKNTTVEVTVSKGKQITIENLIGVDANEAAAGLKAQGLDVSIVRVYSDKIANGKVTGQSLDSQSYADEGDSIVITVSKGPKPFKLEDYTGRELDDAIKDAEKLGLSVETEEKYSSDVEKGKIISQSPDAGETVKKGSTIQFTVSKGVEQVEVPDLSGMSESEATDALKKLGLSISASSEYSSSVSSGNELWQGTEAGAKVDKGSTISVAFSKGAEPSSSSSGSGSSSKKKSSSSKKKSSSSNKKSSSNKGAVSLDF